MPFWLPLIFGAATVAGAVMQANGKKYIDPAWIEENFGSHAFAKEFQKTFSDMQSTAYGQEMLNAAMSQGQQLANTIRQNATNAGFGGAEGVQSGGSLFASSTADQATGSMRRMAQAALAQQAQQQVDNQFQRKLDAKMQAMQQPSRQEIFGGMLANAGMMGLQASLMGGSKPTDVAKTTTASALPDAKDMIISAAINDPSALSTQRPDIQMRGNTLNSHPNYRENLQMVPQPPMRVGPTEGATIDGKWQPPLKQFSYVPRSAEDYKALAKMRGIQYTHQYHSRPGRLGMYE